MLQQVRLLWDWTVVLQLWMLQPQVRFLCGDAHCNRHCHEDAHTHTLSSQERLRHSIAQEEALPIIISRPFPSRHSIVNRHTHAHTHPLPTV
jgi:hypothetical protein